MVSREAVARKAPGNMLRPAADAITALLINKPLTLW